MKKIIYFLPPLLYIAVEVITGFKNVSYNWLIWPLVLILAGILISKDYLRGAVLGLLPSIDIFYTGLQNNNSDLYLGAFFLAFYIISALYILKNRKKSKEDIKKRGN